jgi:hypothetical protein
MDCTISNVGEKLVVGQLDTSFLTAGAKLLPGTAVINGPCYIGATGQAGIARATCMIGTPLGVAAPASLEVAGIANFLGNTNTFGVATFNGIEIKNSLDNSNGVKVNNGAHVTTSNKTITGNLHVTGAITGPTPALWDGKKGFDIPHPSKKDHRLRYICLEGPSAEVYLRGKLKEETVIELPECWRNLVDAETIGVTLTPIGFYQELFVEKIEWGTHIIIKNNSGASVNCTYVVYGERKDTSKNIPEYKGLTPNDYPGDNREYVINGKIIK